MGLYRAKNLFSKVRDGPLAFSSVIYYITMVSYEEFKHWALSSLLQETTGTGTPQADNVVFMASWFYF